MKYTEYKNYFFVGIGGIGMSALAKYLFQNNIIFPQSIAGKRNKVMVP